MRQTHPVIPAGTRIFYSGDRANADGVGTVTGKKRGQIEISLDAQPSEFGEECSVPARVFYVHPLSFEPGPGRRFMMLAEHEAERARRIVAAAAARPVERIYRCRECRVVGYGGEYPFSTLPESGRCDDCVA